MRRPRKGKALTGLVVLAVLAIVAGAVGAAAAKPPPGKGWNKATTTTTQLVTTTSTSTTTTSSTTTTAAPSTTTTSAIPATTGPLPFTMPSKATLRASEKKVFAHYFTPYPISIDNQMPDVDYYTRHYLNPEGENSKFAASGGFLRDRPVPQAPVAGDWMLANFKKEVAQASAAGLDGFTVDLLSLSSYNWTRAKLLLTAAEQVDPTFKIVLMPDATSLSHDELSLATGLAELAKSPASYRLNDGRLVVSPFKAEGETVAYWTNVMSILKNNFGIDVAFVPTFLDYRANVSAFAPISYGFSHWGNRSPAANTATGIKSNIDLAHSMGKIWMQPVSVQDERPYSGIYDEANNTENLRATWQGAINGADWVQMITWNDYSEGTQFAPSQRNNSVYLDLSSYYLAKFKTGTFPAITHDVVYITHRIQRSAALPTYPQTKLMQLRAGSSPARDKVEVLTMLAAPGSVTAAVGDGRQTYDAPSGLHTTLSDLRNGRHSASVARNGIVSAAVTTEYATVDSPYVQDLQYYAVGGGRA